MLRHFPWIDDGLEYSKNGWLLVPLHGQDIRGHCTCGKSCRVPHLIEEEWEKEAASDEATIRSWGDVWSNGRVGVVLGAASNIVVLEVSWLQKGGEMLKNFAEEQGHLPITLSAHVSKFQQRFFFQHPNIPLPPETELAPGLTLLGDQRILDLPTNRFCRQHDEHTWTDPYFSEPSIGKLPIWLLEKAGLLPEGYDEGIAVQAAGPRVYLDFFNNYEEVWHQETPWRLPKIAASGSITALFGTGGKEVGKTRFLQAMAHALLTGQSFLGEAPEIGPVLYFAEDDPASFLAGLKSLATEPTAFQALHTLHAFKYPNTTLEKLVQGALTARRQTGANVLIIDSIHTFAPDMSGAAIAEALQPLCTAGMSVVVTADAPMGYDELTRRADIVLTLAAPAFDQQATARLLTCRSNFPKANMQAVIELRGNGTFGITEREPGQIGMPLRRMAEIPVAPRRERLA